MSDGFHNRMVDETTERLTQDHDPPQMGVHAMSEYIFCKRAGMLTVEHAADDPEAEFTLAPALGGIQSFEPDLIAAELERHTDSLRKIAGVFAGTAALTACAAFYDRGLGTTLGSSGLLGAFATGRLWWWHEVTSWLHCRRRLRQAEEATRREPNWSYFSPQAVNWWQLLKSGFDSRKPKQALYNPKINLKGKPWRILHRNDRHIPVIRISVPEYDGTNLTAVRLYEKHRARIAAYAYLIETCEQARADWAIVLYNDSDDGIAVPLSDPCWKSFCNGLLKARREITELQENPRYRPKPPDVRICAGCPFGCPRPVGWQPTVLANTELPPFATSDSRGEGVFHSTCGDRFQNIPPHHLAEELGLLK